MFSSFRSLLLIQLQLDSATRPWLICPSTISLVINVEVRNFIEPENRSAGIIQRQGLHQSSSLSKSTIYTYTRQIVFRVITLALNPGERTLNDFSASTSDVRGTTVCGASGVFIAFMEPARTVNWPFGATSKGRFIVIVASALSVFAIFTYTSPADLSLVTLQNSVPFLSGKVLGRYSVPLLRLNIFCT